LSWPLPIIVWTIFSCLGLPPEGFGLDQLRQQLMIANSHNIESSVSSQPGPAWADAWHLWKVVFPRRSITGRLVWGTVWRRRNGRHWSYKKFVEYSGD
jgi:hypothetical protein